MALLQSQDALWYQPCNLDLIEQVEGLTWSSGINARLPAGLIGRGLSNANNSSYGYLYHPSGAYAPSAGNGSWTFAFWASGIPGGLNRYFGGWIDSNTGFSNMTVVGVTHNSTSGFTPQARLNGVPTNGSPIQFDVSTSEPWLVVVRVEFSGGSADFLLSVNGSSFQTAGSASIGPPSNTTDSVGVVVFQDTGVGRNILDEAVFWKDTPRFTDGEISNLYELFSVHGLTMDEYSEAFRPNASGVIPLFIDTPKSASGSIPLYANGFLPSASGGLDVVVWCNEASFSGVISLCAIGPSGDHLPVSGYIPLITTGSPNRTHPLFMAVLDGQVSGISPLFTYGSSGVAVAPVSSDIPLYVANDSSPSSRSRSGAAFLKASGQSGVASTPHSLFLKTGDEVGNQTRSMPLTIPGPLASSSHVPMRIVGSGSPGSEGYTPKSRSNSLFIKTQDGTQAYLDFFCEGRGPVDASGHMDLSTYGILGRPSGSVAGFVEGYNIVSGVVPLWLFGVAGVPSGASFLFLLGPDRDDVSGATLLYAHGY